MNSILVLKLITKNYLLICTFITFYIIFRNIATLLTNKSSHMHAFSTEISPENTSHLLNSEYDDKDRKLSLNHTNPIIETKTQTRVSNGFKNLSHQKDLMLEIPHSERNIPISNHLSIKNSPVGSDGPTFGNVNL
jgi:hypothetical protein